MPTEEKPSTEELIRKNIDILNRLKIDFANEMKTTARYNTLKLIKSHINDIEAELARLYVLRTKEG